MTPAAMMLAAAGATSENADAVAAELAATGRLALLPAYVEQVRNGLVDGRAVPEVSLPATAALRIDACGGFAAPALNLAVAALQEVVDQHGGGLAAVVRAHHFPPDSHVVRMLAGRGLAGSVLRPGLVVAWDPLAFGE